MTNQETIKELRHQLALARQEIEELKESNSLKQKNIDALRRQVEDLISK